MLSTHHMLIVDDSRLARLMIRTIVLQKYPHWTLLEARNSSEALVHIESTPSIDLITIDLNMPGGDGLTLATQLQEKYQKRNIVLLTANIQESIRQKAEALGIGFIPKPITKEKILNFLSQMENECVESNRITTR